MTTLLVSVSLASFALATQAACLAIALKMGGLACLTSTAQSPTMDTTTEERR